MVAQNNSIRTFQGIHTQVPLTTSSVMLFPRSLGVSSLSASYTFTGVTQLVLISHLLLKKLVIYERIVSVGYVEKMIKQLIT